MAIDFIKCALEFSKVRIKLLEMTFKGKSTFNEINKIR